MTAATTVLKELESLGTAQNRKVYSRHGVTGPAFGVSYAALGTLRKRLGTDQALAEALWKSGNHDARVLATMVADPAAISAKTLQAWMGETPNRVLADAVARVAADSPHAASYTAWIASKGEFVSVIGWTVVARIADTLAADVARKLLATIESNVHDAPNRTRHNMVMALIAIGSRGDALTDLAKAAAGRIGKVEVDHGDTSCKTPAPVPYIDKVLARRAKKKTPAAKAPAAATRTPAAKKPTKKATAKRAALKKKSARS
ncbi:MAG: DNA alkylation repair protein [Planctomycetota bacterium]